MVLLSSATSLGALAMPWLEAIVYQDAWLDFGCTITVRDWRAPAVWWEMKKPCVSMAKPYLENLLSIHIPPLFTAKGRVDPKAYRGYLQTTGPNIPVYCAHKSKDPRRELRSMRLPKSMANTEAIREIFDQMYSVDWSPGAWLSYAQARSFAIKRTSTL